MIKNVINAGKEKIKWNCEFVGFKNGRLNCKCKEYKKSCKKALNGNNFPTLYKFCNGDLNKVFSAIKKGYLSLLIYG